ncbi:MAG TPA: O-antigen ligase family protein [Gaiellaceae bacterium]
MSARPFSLPSAEHGLSLLVLLVALAFAPLAAAAPRRAAYVLIAGVAVVVVLRSLIAGLALFVVLTFPDQLPGALGVGSTLAKPLGVVILISWLLTIVGDRERLVPFLPREAPVLTYTLLALVVWSLASLIWASDRSLTLHSVSRLVQLVALIFVTYSAVRRPKDLLILVWAFLLGAAVTSVYALANGTLRGGRLTGGIFNPNTLAAEIVVAIVMATFLLIATRRGFLRLLLLAFVSVFAVAFVQTQSRSGILALAAAFAFALVVGGPLRGRLTATVLIAASIGLAYYVYAAPLQLRERVTSIVTETSQASPLREDTWHIALQMTRAHPVHGVGLGNFPALESQYFTSNLNIVQVGSLRRFQLVVHNTYLEILAELGIVGLTLFAAVLAMTIGRVVAMLAQPAREGGTPLLARAIAAATVGVMMSQVFNSGEYSKQLWVLLGMAVAAVALSSKPRLEDAPARGRGTTRFAHVPAI